MADTLQIQPDDVVQVSKMAEHPFCGIVQAHVIARARSPEMGSEFARKTEGIAHKPGADLLQTLMAKGYDGFVFVGGVAPRVVSEIYFQMSPEELGCFSIHTYPQFCHQGYATMLVRRCLNYAWVSGRRFVQVSHGNDRDGYVAKILEKIKRDPVLAGCYARPSSNPYRLELLSMAALVS